MENKLIYWKEAIEDLRGRKEPEFVRALAHARKRASETERVIFRRNHAKIRDNMLERLLDDLDEWLS